MLCVFYYDYVLCINDYNLTTVAVTFTWGGERQAREAGMVAAGPVLTVPKAPGQLALHQGKGSARPTGYLVHQLGTQCCCTTSAQRWARPGRC